MDVSLLTPLGALVGVAVALPLAALLRGRRRVRAVAASLGLPEPPPASAVAAAIVAAAALVAGAAAQPVVEREATSRSVPSAEVVVVLDTSRSMLARPEPGAPSRFERAQRDALALRDRLGDVPVGIASMTDRVLPHLFPSRDRRAYRSTLLRAVAPDRPPPSVNKVVATTLDALSNLATRSFFAQRTDVRVAVVLADFESEPFAPADVGAVFAKERVRLVLVRVGDAAERIFDTPEDSRYAPDPHAGEAAAQLARAAGGRVFREGEVEAVAAAVRAEVDGAARVRGEERRSAVELAPWLGLASLVPVAFVVRRRNRP